MVFRLCSRDKQHHYYFAGRLSIASKAIPFELVASRITESLINGILQCGRATPFPILWSWFFPLPREPDRSLLHILKESDFAEQQEKQVLDYIHLVFADVLTRIAFS